MLFTTTVNPNTALLPPPYPSVQDIKKLKQYQHVDDANIPLGTGLCWTLHKNMKLIFSVSRSDFSRHIRLPGFFTSSLKFRSRVRWSPKAVWPRNVCSQHGTRKQFLWLVHPEMPDTLRSTRGTYSWLFGGSCGCESVPSKAASHSSRLGAGLSST